MDSQGNKRRSIFLSYSGDSREHSEWVKDLGDDLDSYHELHVIFDQYDLDLTKDKNKFMEDAVWDSDRILVVATKRYAERADDRTGGVGIETYLATARQWEEMHDEKLASPVIVIKRGREKNCIPRYLKGKRFIDFSVDSEYQSKLAELLDELATPRQKRPSKSKSLLQTMDREFDFERAEDILRVAFKKRTALITSKEGTDYSRGKRIKYQFWETYTPNIQHFLILHPTSTAIIYQTIERFIEVTKQKGILPADLVVLRADPERPNHTKSLFEQYGVRINIRVFTYSEFVWEYCVDDAWKREPPLFEEPAFVDQEISEDRDGTKDEIGAALKTLNQKIDSDKHDDAIVILAPGGTGKSTLCHKLANAIRTVDRKIPVLIQAEDLRRRAVSQHIANYSIKSAFDLYELYARTLDSESERPTAFDRRTFELCLLCGNLVLILDGLDEIVSLFETGFDIGKFSESLSELNSQLGQSRVIITSRADVFRNMTEDRRGMQFYYLRGFTEKACQEYLNKRIKRTHRQRESVIALIQKYVEDIIANDPDQRILPFYADLLCKMAEDVQDEGRPFSFELSLRGKPYLSNDLLLDSLVFSVFKREQGRQDIEIPIEEVVELFQEIAAETPHVFSRAEFHEKVETLYDSKAYQVCEKLLRNPLLIEQGDNSYAFRYEFLADYFRGLLLIRSIALGEVHLTSIKALERLYLGDSKIVSDVAKYFEKHKQEFKDGAKKWIDKCKEEIALAKGNRKHSERYFRCISALLHICVKTHGRSNKDDTISDHVKALLSVSPNLSGRNELRCIAIYGDFPRMDFSDIDVWDSRFSRFPGFIRSKFTGARFYSSVFSENAGEYPDPTLNANAFDSTCDLGDLRTVLGQAVVEDEVKTFLSRFLENGRFVARKCAGRSTSSPSVRRLVATLANDNDLLPDGRNDDYFIVAKNRHKSVFDFVVNGSRDMWICSVLDRLTKEYT